MNLSLGNDLISVNHESWMSTRKTGVGEYAHTPVFRASLGNSVIY
jgi:hypothetical protein